MPRACTAASSIWESRHSPSRRRDLAPRGIRGACVFVASEDGQVSCASFLLVNAASGALMAAGTNTDVQDHDSEGELTTPAN